MTSNRVFLSVVTCAAIAVLDGAACSSSSGDAVGSADSGVDALANEPCLDTTIAPASGAVVPGQTDTIHFEVNGPGTPPAPTILMWSATGGTLPGDGAGETSVVWTAPATTGSYTIELLYQPIGGALMCVDQIVIYVEPPSTDGGGDDSSDDGGGDDSTAPGDDGGDDSSAPPLDASVDVGVDSSAPPVDAANDTTSPPPVDAGGACARDSGTPPSGPPMNVVTNVSEAGGGAAILISGTNLDAVTYGASLTFPPGVTATGVAEDANGIWFDVPDNASTGFVDLTYTTCAGSAVVPFTVDTTPAPSVTSFTPSTATSGQTIVVNGSHFTGATQVWLTYFPAPAAYALPIVVDGPLVVSDTALTFQVPTITNDEFRYVLVVTPSGAGASASELELSH
jgi:hypothetical protein